MLLLITLLLLQSPDKPKPSPEFAKALKEYGADYYFCGGWCVNGPKWFLEVTRPDPTGKTWPGQLGGTPLTQYIQIATNDFAKAQAIAIDLMKGAQWGTWEHLKNGQYTLERWLVNKDGLYERQTYLSGSEDCRHFYEEAKSLDERRNNTDMILVKLHFYEACVTAGGLR